MAILKSSKVDTQLKVFTTCLYKCTKCDNEETEVSNDILEQKVCSKCGANMRIVSSSTSTE